jgi:AcrR family transcriptional regulator
MTGTVTADATTSRPLRKDAARNRELLIAAAREVFAERGLDASLDDVARRAGLGVGTAYRHFANKHELARAIFKEGIDEMVALAEGCSSGDCPAWDSLVRFLEGAAALQTADRGLREVIMGAHDAEQMERIHDRLTGPLNSLVSRAHEAGELRDGVGVTDVGVVLMMVCTVADVTGDVAPDLWRRYLPMLLDGLRAGAVSPLPVGPISEDDLRTAMSTHKQRLANASGPARPCG